MEDIYLKDCNILIDSVEFQQKVIDYIHSEEFTKMVNSTVFKDEPKCEEMITHGMIIASMLTSRCTFYELTGRIDE